MATAPAKPHPPHELLHASARRSAARHRSHCSGADRSCSCARQIMRPGGALCALRWAIGYCTRRAHAIFEIQSHFSAPRSLLVLLTSSFEQLAASGRLVTRSSLLAPSTQFVILLGRKRRLPWFFHPARQDTVPLRGSHHNSTQRIFNQADTLAGQVRWAVEQLTYLGKDHLNGNMPLCQRALKGSPEARGV